MLRARLVLFLVLSCLLLKGALAWTCEERCDSKIDIVVVFDENCDNDDYGRLKTFGSLFSQSFAIDSDHVRFGGVGYSSNSRALFKWSNSSDSVQHSFNGLAQHNDGHSNAQSGIQRAHSYFNLPHPRREPELQVIIIITKHKPDSCNDHSDPREAAIVEANKCRDERPYHRRIITIYIGDDCDNDYFERLASPGSHYVVSDYRSLSSIIAKIVSQICYRPPTIYPPDDFYAPCNCRTDPSVTGYATAKGWCHGCAPDVTYRDVVVSQYDNEDQKRYIQRTWTASDNCGKSSCAIQLIYLEDIEAPYLTVPDDKTFDCCTNIYKYDFGVATARDKCDPHPNITYVDYFSDHSCPYTLTRTYTATDKAGNYATDVQTITFVDNEPPVVTKTNDFCITPDDNKKYCIYNVSKSGLIEAEDECSEEVDIEFIEYTSECSSSDPSTGYSSSTHQSSTHQSSSSSTYQSSTHQSSGPSSGPSTYQSSKSSTHQSSDPSTYHSTRASSSGGPTYGSGSSGNGPHGSGNGPNGSGNGPHGSGNGPNGSGNGPHGSGNGPNGSGNGPHSSGNGPHGSGNGPNGSGNGPNGSGNGPNGSGNGPNGSGNGPNGSGNGPNGSGNGANGSGNGANGSGNGPNGSGNGPTGSGNGPNGSGNGPTGSGNGPTGSGNGPNGSGNGPNGSGNGFSSSGARSSQGTVSQVLREAYKRLRGLREIEATEGSDSEDYDACRYNPHDDTLCFDAKPCHYFGECQDRIYHVKFAVTDKCGNRREQIVTVTVPAYSTDSRCKNCVEPR